MTEDDRREFGLTMKAVFDYYARDLSGPVLEIYWNALRRYDLAAVKDALGRHAKNPDTGQFCPKVADVEKMLGGSTLDSGLVAWTKVMTAIERLGGYYTVVFDDPLIHRVIEEMGGWVALCSILTKDVPFRMNEFLNRYRGYKIRRETPPHLPKLLGVFDSSNAREGWPVGEENTRMVGDVEAARRVLAAGTESPRIGLTEMARSSTAIVERLEKR